MSNLCIKKILQKKYVDLLLIGGEVKKHYYFIKDFSTFMYDYTLHRRRKHFCRYGLQALTAKKLKCHMKYLKLMVNKKLKC